MAKVNVSLPDELLDEVDELAASLNRSRSGLVQEATALYVAQARDRRAEAERVRSIKAAREDMRELGKHLAPFDSTASIRADRDRNGRKAGDE